MHLQIVYTNWKGQTEVRRIIPLRVYYGCNEWHTTPQYLMDAIDVDKQAERTFAMADIHHMKNVQPNVQRSS